MIKFYEQVPTIYSNASRDFQYLGWLINIVLNSIKHNVDDLYDLPNNKADPRLSELLSMTLGFKIRRNYDQKQLMSLVSVIPSILKNKGNKKALEIAGTALINASGAIGDFDVDVENNIARIVIPETITDITLFTDLLPYILPAGLACEITRKTESKRNYVTEVAYEDIALADWFKDIDIDGTTNEIKSLSDIFDGAITPDFTNIVNDEKPYIVNTDLLSSNVIPVLDTPLSPNNIVDED